MNHTPRRIAVLAIALLAVTWARAATMTNADVVKLVEAKLDEGIILTAIQTADAKFDTSTQGLIELSNAKVPASIVSAIIKKSAAAPTPPSAPPAAAPTAAGTAPASDAMSPTEIIMVDGPNSTPMRYLAPQVRSAARGLGFGGFASYAVLRGSAAATRIKNKAPTFLVSVPNQAQPEAYLTIASFAVRRNDSREVMIGGGYLSYSSGIHPDRIVATTSEKAEDQSRATKGFTIYKVAPKKALGTGEYAVILYTGEVHALVGAFFTGTGNSYFDFGVDP